MRASLLLGYTVACMVISAVLLLALQMSAMEDCIDLGNGIAAFGTLKCALPAGSTFVPPWDTAWYRLGAALSIGVAFAPLVVFLLRRRTRKA
jgi:hypothetical protein